MKTTTQLDHFVRLLRLEDVTGYLIKHGWKKCEFPRPEVLRFQLTVGEINEPLIFELASSEEYADFHFRIRQVIEGLTMIERRTDETILWEMLGNVESIVSSELKRAQLSPSHGCSSMLQDFLESAAFAVICMQDDNVRNRKSFHEKLIHNAVDICQLLAQEGNLIGETEDKARTVWTIFRKILALGNIFHYEFDDLDRFWSAAIGNELDTLITVETEPIAKPQDADKNTARDKP